ncbi:helix-turn-helix transcriptional regulator [Priestia sp. LL-8]|uniref:helix-turn-helix transcriptional regulator n=1 Tax=Priestia sp. LL-8 TaxID=3110068 RepID=UPI002E25B8B3|nr:helix-turn-helix transcriptional regulator [Priestia sp. LL-8]
MTKLEYVRREAGLSQIELAKRIGINSTAIVQVERGHRKCWPKLRKQLAQILEVEEVNLFDEEGWPKKVRIDVRGE